MRATYPLDQPPTAPLIEELTFGKLFSATTEAPEDLHVTSRTSAIDDATVAALQIQSFLDGHDLTASRIDPKCAATGVFLIRTLRGESAAEDRVALVRARLRDHVSLSGARRSHPQLIACVAKLAHFKAHPEGIIKFAAAKKAERVSMDTPADSRFGPANPLPADLVDAGPPPELSPGSDPALLALLDRLAASAGFSVAPAQTHTFGALDFADEAEFLTTLGRALRHLGPRHRAWDRLTVNVGFDGDLPGLVLRYLPSQRTPALRLGPRGFDDLRDRLEGVQSWARLPRAGVRSQKILARAPLTAKPFGARKTLASPPPPPPPSRREAPPDNPGWARFSRALAAYRRKSDRHAFAAEMDDLARTWSPQPDGADRPSPDLRAAWDALTAYRAAPSPDAPLGTLVDGALFHLDRIGADGPDALASAWFARIDSALHESVVLAPEELAALEAANLLERLVEQRECRNVNAILRASIALKSGVGPSSHRRKLEDRLAQAGRAMAGGSFRPAGLSGLFVTTLDAIYPAPAEEMAGEGLGSGGSPL